MNVRKLLIAVALVCTLVLAGCSNTPPSIPPPETGTAGDAVYLFFGKGTTFQGPYAASYSTKSMHAGHVELIAADATTTQAIEAVFDNGGMNWCGLRCNGKLYLAQYCGANYGSDSNHRASNIKDIDLEVHNCLGSARDYDTKRLTDFLEHHLTYCDQGDAMGWPVASLPNSGLSLTALRKQLRASHEFGIICAEGTTALIQVDTMQDQRVPISSWPAHLKLRDGRVMYCFESPEVSDLSGGAIPPQRQLFVYLTLSNTPLNILGDPGTVNQVCYTPGTKQVITKVLH